MTRSNGTRLDALRRHFLDFSGLLKRAADLLGAGNLEGAAAYAQIAADYAYHNHPGLFVSAELERVLLSIAEKTPGHMPAQDNHLSRRSCRHVLHVLTQAYSVGGHSRMAWRWIEEDSTRTHSVVLTRQSDHPIPAPLTRAVMAAGGTMHLLDRGIGGLLARANALRRIAQGTDQVVLNVHPFDVLPMIAFSGLRLPIAFVNHADHLFWVGASLSSVVAHIRRSGLNLSVARRGIDERRCVVLPIPIKAVQRTIAREEAKQRLGFARDAVVILSIASEYKYTPIDGSSLGDAVLPVLSRHPNSLLAIVGAGPDGVWKEAVAAGAGRVRAFGTREDTAIFYQAADVYLDSFPFASLTSMLEAGMFAVPLISYCPHYSAAAVMCSDDVSLDDCIVRGHSLEAFQEKLSDLLQFAHVREELGRKTRQSIAAAHCGTGWHQRLETVYSRSTAGGRTKLAANGEDHPSETSLDAWTVALQQESGAARGMLEFIVNHAGLLPAAERFRFWREIAASERSPRFGVLLPEWSRILLRQCYS